MWRRDLAWTVVSSASGLGAALITRQAATALWRAASGREPPANPADRSTSWAEALIWVVAVSVGAGVARLIAERSAVAAWEAVMEEAPPGIDRAA